MATVLLTSAAQAQSVPGQVLAHDKVSEIEGGFAGALDPFDGFGRAIAMLGDVDGDGTDDLAVGAPFDDDGGFNPGALWILFLEDDGSIRDHQKISLIEGDFPDTFEAASQFGGALAGLGDIDGNGVPDLAVGAPSHNDGGADRGAIWILFLESDGTVLSAQKIGSTSGGLVGPLSDGDLFGTSIANVGDFDGNGMVDLAVGAVGDDGGGFGRGAVWILFLGLGATVIDEVVIGDSMGGFGGTLHDLDAFGSSVTTPGDLNGDRVDDLVVGAVGYGDTGALWVLFLAPDGSVTSEQLITNGAGDFMGDLEAGDGLGVSLTSIGDVDADGRVDVAAGSYADDDGGNGKGAVWILFLEADGNVKTQKKISATQGGFSGQLDEQDAFGYALAKLDDLDGDDRPDVAVGAYFDDDGSLNQGAFYLLYLDGIPPAAVKPYGCGVNPADSLFAVSGPPTAGTPIDLGIDNPLGTQAPGSATMLLVSLSPDPSHPCGTLIPDWGMSGPGAAGELLVDLFPGEFVLLVIGPPWVGPGTPSVVQASVPGDPSFLGLSAYVQGLVYDPAATFGVEVGLTEALELRIGP